MVDVDRSSVSRDESKSVNRSTARPAVRKRTST
jgi:hypothetical protein